MENPPNLTYCKIVGNFRAFIGDMDDVDDLPDFVPMTGSGLIWPDITTAKNMTPGQKATYFTKPIPLVVDADGDLGRNDKKYVMVVAPDETSGMNPIDFTYSISFTLGGIGESSDRTFGPYSFSVVPGGTIDIVDIIPVSSSSGTPIIQGPKGEQGNTSINALPDPNDSDAIIVHFPTYHLDPQDPNILFMPIGI